MRRLTLRSATWTGAARPSLPCLLRSKKALKSLSPSTKNQHRFTACAAKQYPRGQSPRQIVILRVFLDHAVGGELRHERDHRPPDALDPFARDALRVAFEKQGDDLLGKRAVQVGA